MSLRLSLVHLLLYNDGIMSICFSYVIFNVTQEKKCIKKLGITHFDIC